MKRYVESSKPKPLKSNWPDLPCPKLDYQKAWRYRVFTGKGHMILETKNLEHAYSYMALMHNKNNKLYLQKYEPTGEALHDERQREKSEWRWSHGFGA